MSAPSEGRRRYMCAARMQGREPARMASNAPDGGTRSTPRGCDHGSVPEGKGEAGHARETHARGKEAAGTTSGSAVEHDGKSTTGGWAAALGGHNQGTVGGDKGMHLLETTGGGGDGDLGGCHRRTHTRIEDVGSDTRGVGIQSERTKSEARVRAPDDRNECTTERESGDESGRRETPGAGDETGGERGGCRRELGGRHVGDERSASLRSFSMATLRFASPG